MSVAEMTDAGASRTWKVWDPLVRLIHWALALTILVNGAFTDPEHEPHHLVGYVALGLVGTRLVWGLIGPRHARLSSFLPNPMAAIRHLGEIRRGTRKLHLSHNPLGALMVYNIWATVVGMGVTGIMMGTVRFFGREWVEETHEALFTWLLVSIGLHLAGVVLETLRSGVNLVPAMAHGKKRVPDGWEVE